jgi:hypothetical protein
MAAHRLNNEEGFTLVEVLVSATVFMIGFAILIAVLSGTLAKFSTQDTNLARGIGEEYMNRTIFAADTTGLDTVVCRSGINFRVSRSVVIGPDLAIINLLVTRQTTGRKLLDFYYEMALPHK